MSSANIEGNRITLTELKTNSWQHFHAFIETRKMTPMQYNQIFTYPPTYPITISKRFFLHLCLNAHSGPLPFLLNGDDQTYFKNQPN